jgi:predicted AlkP superfamily phosphohydrolase/phosphomutase
LGGNYTVAASGCKVHLEGAFWDDSTSQRIDSETKTMSLKNRESSELMTRRGLLRAAGALTLAAGCDAGRSPAPGDRHLKRMIVLGVDGMDHGLVQKFIAEGFLPNCKRLMDMGSISPLATSTPPQSPVAWSNFISGTNPGGHGIFDFIARDPDTMLPYQSISRLVPGRKPLAVGNFLLPTSAGRIESLRHGATLWNELEGHGVPCTVFRVPANFPPTEGEARTLAGMGTPDLQGGYGTFTWYTDDPKERTRDVSGGRIERVLMRDDTMECRLRGPANEFSAKQETVEIPLTIHRDANNPVVRLVVQDTTIILKEKEWSDWVVVKFPMIPHVVEASGICRFYLKSVRQPFGLYVSPMNIDPANPSLPLSTPPDYSKQLVKELGYYYTQGMVEDTHALSANVLDAGEYRQQAMFVHDERMRFFEHELGRFEDGFLFFYFSTLDLSSHVFWRAIDPEHPEYDADLAASQGDFIRTLYEKVDHAIGLALDRLDERSWLIVMSDHGFASFRRQFNLNSWLLENGFMRTNGPPVRAGSSNFQDVDWSRTRAFGLGLNGLYLNRKGREKNGCVEPADAESLEQELVLKLKQVRDPETGDQVITNVFRASEIYSGPHVTLAPDLIVGYNRNYRASWDTILGGFPRELVLDNRDAWSGDHCIDPQFVPGVLLSSRRLESQTPRLEDLAPTILTAFHASVPASMTGTTLE